MGCAHLKLIQNTIKLHVHVCVPNVIEYYMCMNLFHLHVPVLVHNAIILRPVQTLGVLMLLFHL